MSLYLRIFSRHIFLSLCIFPDLNPSFSRVPVRYLPSLRLIQTSHPHRVLPSENLNGPWGILITRSAPFIQFISAPVASRVRTHTL
ncbi:hypothetical protein GGS24DRAFT_270163 [Hypoxylon argillaceum]|nr:hypothetical protein GGS24DRAFT_270163 [Hypoxylon argillaceum]KAI1144959.1 hypothetical protein F4825DRAFT_283825 [Nemania diffusa]